MFDRGIETTDIYTPLVAVRDKRLLIIRKILCTRPCPSDISEERSLPSLQPSQRRFTRLAKQFHAPAAIERYSERLSGLREPTSGGPPRRGN